MKVIQLILGIITIFMVLVAVFDWPLTSVVILLISALFLFQGAITVLAMLYTWENEDRLKSINPPTPRFEKPKHSFSLIIPARHEEKVIGDTLRAMSRLDYPQKLLEVLVVVRQDDLETIKEISKTLNEINRANFHLIVFDGEPINKPHTLNIGLYHAQHEVVGVFDAEDEPHPQILRFVDLKLRRDQVDVVQAGVQLINLDTAWFSPLNCLEYYFWYKSVLPFFSSLGATPVGGNSVFFKKAALIEVLGWDENCLTEDADVGVRLSLSGYRIGTIYQERLATLEETPPDLEGFVCQRSRWDQGYLQIALKGDLFRFSEFKQQLLMLYLFLQPMIHLLALVSLILLPYSAIRLKVPTGLAMFSFVPGYVLLLQLGIFVVGLFEMGEKYDLKISPRHLGNVIFGFFSYQLVLGYSFLRAMGRLILGFSGWEKTVHVNAHRKVLPALSLVTEEFAFGDTEKMTDQRLEMIKKNSLSGVIFLGTPHG
jgi:cellulose synthase/poly-beta-1,6-N-acetylglucosamine synthase-like glycosyltransferase